MGICMKRTFKTRDINEYVDRKNRLNENVNEVMILGAKFLTVGRSVYKHRNNPQVLWQLY